MRLSETHRVFTPETTPMLGFAGLVRRMNIDVPLLGALLLICGFGLFVLSSAVGDNDRLLINQSVRMGLALVAMLVVAQLPPDFLRRWTPWGYVAGLILLVLVLTKGEVGQGARRWLDFGVRFQPSEAMKLAVPMMTAWFLHERQIPARPGHLLLIAVLIAVAAAAGHCNRDIVDARRALPTASGRRRRRSIDAPDNISGVVQ